MRFHAIIAAALLAASCCTAPVQEGNGTASSTFNGNTVDYNAYFTPERLRLDFVLAGDSNSQQIFLEEMHREAQWAGSPESLIDPFGYGQYWFEAFSKDGELIYSHGFSTLFEEWRTTAQAEKVPMAASQTLWMPFPKDTIEVVVYQRIRETGRFERMFGCEVDPADRHIIPGPDNAFAVKPMMVNGDMAKKVDLLFVAEGYSESSMDKFRIDSQRMIDYLFTMEPYASRKDDFNIWLVESTSGHDGVDIPQDGVWRDTAMDSGFDTFYEDRYLTILNHKKIASAVSGAPFDALFIIANESKYGGGGIYNSYAMGTSDHRLSLPVFIHEFGHSFAGLGDEYYDSSVAYEDYYPAGVEPWEPNITTQVDFASKWADMVETGTPLPTPADSTFTGVVGLYEGAGYMAHGCWRPFIECRMLNNTAPGFCPVCQRAISRMIDFYTR